MLINEFNKLVTIREGKKVSENIAQVNEQMAIVRALLKKAGIDIYQVIRSVPKEVFYGNK